MIQSDNDYLMDLLALLPPLHFVYLILVVAKKSTFQYKKKFSAFIVLWVKSWTKYAWIYLLPTNYYAMQLKQFGNSPSINSLLWYIAKVVIQKGIGQNSNRVSIVFMLYSKCYYWPNSFSFSCKSEQKFQGSKAVLY